MKKLHIALALLFLFGIVSASSAQTKPKGIFSVSPAILNISLSPGKLYTYDIKIANLLSSPLPVRAEIDRVLGEEDTGGASSIASWAKISESDMIIPAHSNKTIRLTIQTPNKIPLGGYYGTLFLQPISPVKSAASQYVQGRAGVVILANVGVPDQSARAEIQNVSFEKSAPAHRLLRFDVKNLSLYHFSAKSQLVVKPLLGDTKTFDVNEKIILPGKTRNWEETIAWPYRFFNIYDVRLLVSVGNGEQIVYQSRYIDLPYKMIAVIALLAVIIPISYKRRKKLRKALRILIKNK